MEFHDRWYCTKVDLKNTPSRLNNIDAAKELSYRQQTALFIQDMGKKLNLSQHCINSATMYMHRFYVFHSFSKLDRNILAIAAVFLTAKIEEEYRRVEHVINVGDFFLHRNFQPIHAKSEGYFNKILKVIAYEDALLCTLGFDLSVEHAHIHILKTCKIIKANKELCNTSYLLATVNLQMTTMCLKYRPTVIACVCIHLACKWLDWHIEPFIEGKEWYYYVDKSVTLDLLETLTQEFAAILEKSPYRFESKFIAQKQNICQVSKSEESSKQHSSENKTVVKKDVSSPGPSTSNISLNICSDVEDKPIVAKVDSNDKKRHAPLQPIQLSSPKRMKKTLTHSNSISIDVYREEKEKERLKQRSAPIKNESVTTQPLVNKPQPASSDHEKVHKKASSSSELHLHPAHQEDSSLMNKENYCLQKIKSGVSKNKVSRVELKLLSSRVSNDTGDVLKKVNMKSDVQDSSISAAAFLVPKASLDKPVNIYDHKYPSQTNNVTVIKETTAATVTVPVASSSSVATKLKHARHKMYSMGNDPNCTLKDKSVSNHSEPSRNSPIWVSISKDFIKLPEVNPLPKHKNLKKPLKNKVAKPIMPDDRKDDGTGQVTPIRLIFTKDKSGTETFRSRVSFSPRNDQQSKKRKSHGKQDQSCSSHTNIKQSKSRNSSSMDQTSKDVKSNNLEKSETDCPSIDVESCDVYNNQHFPYQMPSPPLNSFLQWSKKNSTTTPHPPP